MILTCLWKHFTFYAIWVYTPRKNLDIQVKLPLYQYGMRMASTLELILQIYNVSLNLYLSTKCQYLIGTGRPGQFVETVYSSIYQSNIDKNNTLNSSTPHVLGAPCIWLTNPQLQPWSCTLKHQRIRWDHHGILLFSCRRCMQNLHIYLVIPIKYHCLTGITILILWVG